MKRFSEQFKKQGDRIIMRASEKEELKARVVSYMEYHPLQKEISVKTTSLKQSTESIVSEPFFAIPFNKIYVRSFAGVFAMFLIVGVPFVAEQALPGDVLYPVKVQFNEELLSTLSFSPYAKVEWETQRLERRISEARLLASEGRLTDAAQADFAQAVKVHTDAAQREIAVLRASDSDSAAIAEIAFASALAVQSQVLEGRIEHGADTLGNNEGHSVLALAEVVAQARTNAESAQTGSQPSYDKLLAAVEEESTRAYELFASVKSSASSEEITDVERRLSDIERKRQEAIARKDGKATENEIATLALSASISKQSSAVQSATLSSNADVALSSSSLTMVSDTKDAPVMKTSAVADTVQTEEEGEPVVPSEEDAIMVLRVALTDIQKLLSYLTNIDVRENVSIEELVPVTPTTEERVQKVMQLIDDSRAIKAQVQEKNISPKLQNKVQYAFRGMERYFAEVTKAMGKGDVEKAHTLAQEAYNIATDIQKLTANESVREGGAVVTENLDTSSTTLETTSR